MALIELVVAKIAHGTINDIPEINSNTRCLTRP